MWVISVHQPLLGASPDAVINCDCCGNGCLEIKCSYSVRDKYISELLNSKNSCLENNGVYIALKKSHKYYYQVQCQLYASSSNYCDFFIWTSKDWYCDRNFLDLEFMDRDVIKCKHFFFLNHIFIKEEQTITILSIEHNPESYVYK